MGMSVTSIWAERCAPTASGAILRPKGRQVVGAGDRVRLDLPGGRLTVGGAVATAGFQLMFVTGTDSVDAAMERIENFKVRPIGGDIRCPFLVVHGAEDQQVPPGDAERMFDAIGSPDKTLLICDGRNAGAAHCQFDNHLPALMLIGDWLHTKLAAPAAM